MGISHNDKKSNNNDIRSKRIIQSPDADIKNMCVLRLLESRQFQHVSSILSRGIKVPTPSRLGILGFSTQRAITVNHEPPISSPVSATEHPSSPYSPLSNRTCSISYKESHQRVFAPTTTCIRIDGLTRCRGADHGSTMVAPFTTTLVPRGGCLPCLDV